MYSESSDGENVNAENLFQTSEAQDNLVCRKERLGYILLLTKNAMTIYLISINKLWSSVLWKS